MGDRKEKHESIKTFSVKTLNPLKTQTDSCFSSRIPVSILLFRQKQKDRRFLTQAVKKSAFFDYWPSASIILNDLLTNSEKNLKTLFPNYYNQGFN